MAYEKSLEPMSKQQLAQIPCYSFVNCDVQERDLQELDALFLKDKAQPTVFKRLKNGEATFWAEHEARDDVQVDWIIYRTWENTFSLRYRDILSSMGLNPSHRFFDPQKQWQIATTVERHNLEPLSLSEALGETYAA
ncbi:hypothetical protein ABXZ88_003202 [Vibrio fluvialis]